MRCARGTDKDTPRRSPKLFRVAESAFTPISAASELERVKGPCYSQARSAACALPQVSSNCWRMRNSARELLNRDTRYLDADQHRSGDHAGVRGLPDVAAA